MKVSPLLTIAIPTWNRSIFLEKNLKQLGSEMAGVATGTVEIIVSDNCSSDSTPAVVKAASLSGLPINYVRNQENIGWGANFAQCFNFAKGKYVLLLGDDDLLVDGALELLLNRLSVKTYGVVYLRSYGFDWDFRDEYPGRFGNEKIFKDGSNFLLAIGAGMTGISSCVFNKDLLPGVDTRELSSFDLAHLHFVLRAALVANENLIINKYLIACKRNNSSAYGFSDVFVNELWRTVDSYTQMGLRRDVVRRIEARFLFSYYPFYLLGLRLNRSTDLKVTLKHFTNRFRDRWQFRYWLAPTLWLPRNLSIIWGSVTTLFGRVADGDLFRGITFAWYRLVKKVCSTNLH